MTFETHPLEPFLPENARMLFLGSFPPPKARWSMDFFYPNWINDFWRIMGLLFFADKQYFELTPSLYSTPKTARRFDKEKIIEFCMKEGLAFYDTAERVCRLKDNADDKYLEIVERTDVLALLGKMPSCRVIITTGGKASEELQYYFEKMGISVSVPKLGEKCSLITLNGEREIVWWRMPSTSRAFPMKIEKKAEYYCSILMSLNINTETQRTQRL